MGQLLSMSMMEAEISLVYGMKMVRNLSQVSMTERDVYSIS